MHKGTKKIKTSDLRRRDVVELDEGRYLGNICDVDLDPQTGKIKSLIVDQPHSFLFWKKSRSDLEVAWRDVVLVGMDVILIKNSPWHR